MKVLITGASGFLGSCMARRALRDGLSVRALVRANRKVPPGVEVAEGDLSRADDLRRALEGCDAVVHCGARVQTGGPWAEFGAINIDAVQRLIELGSRAGVRHIVHISSLSVYGIDRDGVVITEDSPYEAGAASRGFYSQSKLAADQVALESITAGAPVTVLRPGVLYGPGRRPPLGRQSYAVGPLRLILGRPDYLLPLSYGDNVADAIALALQRPQSRGRVYTIVDPQVPMREYLEEYRAAAGATWRAVFVSPGLAVAVARPASAVFRLLRRRSPVTPYQIRRATWSARFDCTRAATELGWTARVGLREGLQKSVGGAARPAAAAVSSSHVSYETH